MRKFQMQGSSLVVSGTTILTAMAGDIEVVTDDSGCVTLPAAGTVVLDWRTSIDGGQC